MSFDLEARGKKGKVRTAPVYSETGIPYDYIVLIDSGSKGSRVYVYNWLNPAHALEAGMNLTDITEEKPKLVKRSYIQKTRSETKRYEENSVHLVKRKKNKTKKPSPHESVLFPKISTGKKWHLKIKPGISSFNAQPQKVGKHHVKQLLQLALSIVPKSQHSRTPIFLHATAGMRLLTPTEQQQINDNICSYIGSNSDFYIPECASHVNVLNGDVEGLYGWLAINSLIGAFDSPQDHDHGKSHYTYGLLDMGGASTQVVFQPNATEIKEHENNLYKINLAKLPLLGEEKADSVVGKYELPQNSVFNVYSDSFLGYGMYQARSRYLKKLVASYNKEHNIDSSRRWHGLPIPDPCLPKGLTMSEVIGDISYDFTGESNFQGCVKLIFPVLLESTHSSGTEDPNTNCKQFNEENKVSSCLLSDLIPAFDFDVNHFIGVSGYWDAIENLLSYNEDKNEKRDDSEEEESHKIDESGDTYDYKIIYKETSKLCSQLWGSLIELNSLKEEDKRMQESDLSVLCFKSSWILNFLHLGLGFPRFGIDEDPYKDNKFKSLQLVDEVGGSSFSWTLGRALIYANDEYVQAFNNYTKTTHGREKRDEMLQLLNRPGFYHSVSPNVYHYGAEQNNIWPRPLFEAPRKDDKYTHYDYESYEELKWYIEPHRWYGIAIFMLLMAFIIWLLVGKPARTKLFDKIKKKVKGVFSRSNYLQVPTEDIEAYEMHNVREEDQFKIDSEEEN